MTTSKEINGKRIEDLLKPRFMLIAPYPGSTREVGSISIEVATASYFRKFPANFRELFWWEEKKEDEMPEYIKWEFNDVPYPVKGYEKVLRWESLDNFPTAIVGERQCVTPELRRLQKKNTKIKNSYESNIRWCT